MKMCNNLILQNTNTESNYHSKYIITQEFRLTEKIDKQNHIKINELELDGYCLFPCRHI